MINPKKTLLTIFLWMSLFLTGCSKPELPVAHNPYFCIQDKVHLTAMAEYYSTDSDDEAVLDLEIYKVREYDEGSLYHLKIERPQNAVSSLDEARTNIYLYVTEDKIYRVWSYLYEQDEVITFYDDDETASKVLDTEDKIIENSKLVCQEEELLVDVEDGKTGMYCRISKEGNKIENYATYIKVNGERDFYEWFTWEKGKGLVSYGSGFRAEADILYLDIVYDK